MRCRALVLRSPVGFGVTLSSSLPLGLDIAPEHQGQAEGLIRALSFLALALGAFLGNPRLSKVIYEMVFGHFRRGRFNGWGCMESVSANALLQELGRTRKKIALFRCMG